MISSKPSNIEFCTVLLLLPKARLIIDFFADSSVSCGPSDYQWHDQLSTHLSLDAVIAEPSFVFNESYLLALDRQSRPQPSLNGQKMMLGTYESLLGRHSSSQVTLYASASFIEPED